MTMDYKNARLVRFEQGVSADLKSINSVDFPTPHYFAFVFLKGDAECKDIYRTDSNIVFNLSYLKYLNKIVEKKETSPELVQYIFTDGTFISMS